MRRGTGISSYRASRISVGKLVRPRLGQLLDHSRCRRFLERVETLLFGRLSSSAPATRNAPDHRGVPEHVAALRRESVQPRPDHVAHALRHAARVARTGSRPACCRSPLPQIPVHFARNNGCPSVRSCSAATSPAATCRRASRRTERVSCTGSSRRAASASAGACPTARASVASVSASGCDRVTSASRWCRRQQTSSLLSRGNEFEQLERWHIGAVQVVEHEQQRLARAPRRA